MLIAASKGLPTVDMNEESLLQIYASLNKMDEEEDGLSLMETVAFFQHENVEMKAKLGAMFNRKMSITRK